MNLVQITSPQPLLPSDGSPARRDFRFRRPGSDFGVILVAMLHLLVSNDKLCRSDADRSPHTNPTQASTGEAQGTMMASHSHETGDNLPFELVSRKLDTPKLSDETNQSKLPRVENYGETTTQQVIYAAAAVARLRALPYSLGIRSTFQEPIVQKSTQKGQISKFVSPYIAPPPLAKYSTSLLSRFAARRAVLGKFIFLEKLLRELISASNNFPNSSACSI